MIRVDHTRHGLPPLIYCRDLNELVNMVLLYVGRQYNMAAGNVFNFACDENHMDAQRVAAAILLYYMSPMQMVHETLTIPTEELAQARIREHTERMRSSTKYVSKYYWILHQLWKSNKARLK